MIYWMDGKTHSEKYVKRMKRSSFTGFISALIACAIYIFAILIMLVYINGTPARATNVTVETNYRAPNGNDFVDIKRVINIDHSDEYSEEYPAITYSKDWSAEDEYWLAKIAMAEAGSEDTYTKSLVIMTVLNRVNDERFPNTIYEVIHQNNGRVWQFAPVKNEAYWNSIVPNEDCQAAIEMVKKAKYDFSLGCLYFESVKGDSWHSRNLMLLIETENMRFYKEKGE